MASRSKTTTQPGASKAPTSTTPRISALEHRTEEDFTSINAMLTTLSGALDRDPDRIMPEDMQAFCWQVYLIHQKVEELKIKVTTFDHN